MAKAEKLQRCRHKAKSGIHPELEAGVQLLQGSPAACTLQSYGRGQFGPSSHEMAFLLKKQVTWLRGHVSKACFTLCSC